MKHLTLFGCLFWLLTQNAFACRICQIHLGILDPNFIFYIIAVILPFIILGLVVYLLYF